MDFFGIDIVCDLFFGCFQAKLYSLLQKSQYTCQMSVFFLFKHNPLVLVTCSVQSANWFVIQVLLLIVSIMIRKHTLLDISRRNPLKPRVIVTQEEYVFRAHTSEKAKAPCQRYLLKKHEVFSAIAPHIWYETVRQLRKQQNTLFPLKILHSTIRSAHILAVMGEGQNHTTHSS